MTQAEKAEGAQRPAPTRPSRRAATRACYSARLRRGFRRAGGRDQQRRSGVRAWLPGRPASRERRCSTPSLSWPARLTSPAVPPIWRRDTATCRRTPQRRHRAFVEAGAVGLNLEDTTAFGLLLDRAVRGEERLYGRWPRRPAACVNAARVDVFLAQMSHPTRTFSRRSSAGRAYRGRRLRVRPGVLRDDRRACRRYRRLCSACSRHSRRRSRARAGGRRAGERGSGPYRAALSARFADEVYSMGTFGSARRRRHHHVRRRADADEAWR